MTLYSKNTRLADVFFEYPEAITVANRLGVYLGVGDKTIDELCRNHGIETGFFVVILNTYLNEDYFPENIFRQFDFMQILNYLKKTDAYYSHAQIPNIERHFDSLISHSAESSNNLSLMKGFFTEMKDELLGRIQSDDLLKAINHDQISNMHSEVDKAEERDNIIEDKIDDLLSFFILHLRGEYDHNLCQAVIMSLFTLSKDIKQNNRIRRRILFPLLR